MPSRGAENIDLLLGGCANIVWNTLSLVVGTLVLGLLLFGVFTIGLFAFATLGDAPLFEVIPKRYGL